MVATGQTSALQLRRATGSSGTISAFGPALPGTGFETLPPLSILFKPFQFLKFMCLKSVGLGLDSVPFHAGWELAVWKPYLSMSEWLEYEFEKICDEIEVDDSIEDFGPQIELNLENPEDLGGSPVEVARVAPTEMVEVEEEESSMEFLASGKKMVREQAEEIGVVPVPEAAELKREGQTVGTGEPVLEVDRSGEEPDLMKVCLLYTSDAADE